MTSKCEGSEESNFQNDSSVLLYSYHYDSWSELGDGGRRYRSVPKGEAFSCLTGEGRKSSTAVFMYQDGDSGGESKTHDKSKTAALKNSPRE